MPETNNNGRSLERRVRFLVLFAAAIATVIIFAWRSQAKQDVRIWRNETAVVVIQVKLDAIVEKIDEVRAILSRAHDAPTQGASWQEDEEGRRVSQERTSSFPTSD